MTFLYRKVDSLLADSSNGEVGVGDTLLVERDRPPGEGELVLVRVHGSERLRRWREGLMDDVLGVVIGIRRRL